MDTQVKVVAVASAAIPMSWRCRASLCSSSLPSSRLASVAVDTHGDVDGLVSGIRCEGAECRCDEGHELGQSRCRG